MEIASQYRLADFTDRLVGFELEHQLIDRDGGPLSFGFMQTVWASFAACGWDLHQDPVFDVTGGATKSFSGRTVTLSSDTSAGNLEVALPPMATVADGERLRRAVFEDVVQVTADHHVRVCALGMHPGTCGDLDGLRLRSNLYWALEQWAGSAGSTTACRCR